MPTHEQMEAANRMTGGGWTSGVATETKRLRTLSKVVLRFYKNYATIRDANGKFIRRVSFSDRVLDLHYAVELEEKN